ncbi:MAG: hypothetical protein H8F28_23820 [Fibrella sp.]|nr:hypothetical protein [Armatimonadota bacterium]
MLIKHRNTSVYCHLPFLVLAFGLALPAQARQESRATKQAAPKPGAVRQPQSLRDDPRLQSLISVARRRQTGSLLSELSRVAKVRLTTDEADIAIGETMLFAQKVPTWQIMDAMAGLGTNRWVYQEKTRGYLLMGSRHEYDILLPKNEHERECNRLGIELASLIETTLDDSVKNALAEERPIDSVPQKTFTNAAGEEIGFARKSSFVKGIALSDLPPATADLARRMLWAQVASLLQQGRPPNHLPFREGTPLPADTTLRFRLKEDKSGYRQYKVNVGALGVGGIGFSVSDYEQRAKKREAALQTRRTAQARRGGSPAAPEFVYEPEEDRCKPEELDGIEALQRRVRIKPTRLTYQEAVRELARQCDVPCATLCERTIAPNKSVPMTVALDDMTLREALDALTEQFGGTGEWEWRKAGTLIARQPRLATHFSDTLGKEKPKSAPPPKPTNSSN